MAGIKRIYIAGLLTPRGVWNSNLAIDYLENVRRMLRVGVEAIKAGFAPFVPGMDMLFFLVLQPGEQLTELEIKEMSKDWLEVSDAMLLTEGWQRSSGTLAEMELAKERGIPVFENLEELKRAAGKSPSYAGS